MNNFMKYGMITVINYDVIEFWLCGVHKNDRLSGHKPIINIRVDLFNVIIFLN